MCLNLSSEELPNVSYITKLGDNKKLLSGVGLEDSPDVINHGKDRAFSRVIRIGRVKNYVGKPKPDTVYAL